MQMLKGLVIGVVGLIVLLALVGLVLPSTAHVERSVVIKAAPAEVFPEINSMREFNRWSPWSDLDPNMTTTYTGPTSGVGAEMSWVGNASVGTGSQEIIESVPDQRVKTKLVFGGYDHPSTASFVLTPVDAGTRVTWNYDTSMGYDIVSRYFGLMLDHWIGKDYEKGLITLSHVVGNPQNSPAPAFSAGKSDSK
ncbi:MAG: SRPBCC family protein [Stenotrophobium sp.]